MEKQRQIKILSIVALLLAISGMTLGFAAFSSTLNISSSASVSPDSSTFSVEFFESMTSGYKTHNGGYSGGVLPMTMKGATASTAIVEGTSLSNVNVQFTMPGQSARYDFYVGNVGEYDAYLTDIIYGNVSSYNMSKVCTPGEGATASLVASACDSINISITVGDVSVDETSSNINDLLMIGDMKEVSLNIFYDENGALADGPFSIQFGDISFVYSTVASSNVITFTINSTSYQAEEGMTWAEWVDSEYNVDGWQIMSGTSTLYLDNNNSIYYLEGIDGLNESIVADYIYFAARI